MVSGAPPAPSPEHGFRSPPVWEVAISAGTAGDAIDDYDIKGLHDLFRSELPIVEKQGPVSHLPLLAYLGMNYPFQESSGRRWWFISEDEERVLQVQDRFIASNWRRRGTVPGMPFEYPGFDKIIDSAIDRVSRLRERKGDFPSPLACELMYDNLIPVRLPDGTVLRLSEILADYTKADDRYLFDWKLGWLESIDGLPADDQSILQVQSSFVGLSIPNEPEPLPLIKLTFNAAAVRNTWEDVFKFCDVAHNHIRKRLMDLTTRKVQELWIPK